MSGVQDLMHAIHEAVDAYSTDDASNIFLNSQDVHAGARSIVLMTKTCYVEFDPMSPRAKLPACFARDIGLFIRGYVILQDPEGNRIQVSLERKDIRIYLARGWSRLRDFYSLGLGGWVTITYMSPLLFYILVRKLSGQEVSYPQRTPPHKLMLLDQILTNEDTKSGVLKLSWHGFCEQALPHEGTDITLVDWLGYTWECHFDFGDPGKKTCQVTRQWLDICKKHRFVEGITVKFGVTHASDNKVIHLKIAPFIGVRTTLIGPRVAAGYKAFYQTENYFLL